MPCSTDRERTHTWTSTTLKVIYLYICTIMNKVLVDGIKGSSMWFFHKDQFRERIRSDNTNEVLRNAPKSQQPFIDSDSEKGQFEPSVRARLPMACFSASRKWRTQYNKTFTDSHSSRLYGAKLLWEIDGETEARTYTNLLTYIHTQTAFPLIFPTLFHSLTVVWIYANDVN